MLMKINLMKRNKILENSQDKNTDENQPQNEEEQGNLSEQSEYDIEDLDQVQRVLEMLEKLEEESLKNNQGIVIEGEESKYGW